MNDINQTKRISLVGMQTNENVIITFNIFDVIIYRDNSKVIATMFCLENNYIHI
jgi:hypothetical protein